MRQLSSKTGSVSLYGLAALFLAGHLAAAELPMARPESVGMSSERLTRLTAAMKTPVEANKLSGVVTMIARNGKIVHVEATGKRDITAGDPMKRDTIFRIYSMTKPITGVAMMLLHEEGKWQLNDPVSRYIPEFAGLKVAKVDPVTGAIKQVEPDHPINQRAFACSALMSANTSSECPLGFTLT